MFYLGTKYSEAMNATYLDENGKPQLMEMGCYGIGVTRLLGAAIEQNHDERGIVWPAAIAPFAVVICPIGYDRSAEVKAAADALHDELLAPGIDVMLDDRGERPGAMFADWELIGVPHRVVISDRGLKDGQVEYQGRRDAQATHGPARPRSLAFAEGQARQLMSVGPARRSLMRAGAWLRAALSPLAGWPRTVLGRRARSRSRWPTAVRSALSAAIANSAPPKPAFDTHRGAPGLPALARRDERAAEAPQGRAP